MIDILNKLAEEKTLKLLYDNGFLKIKTFNYVDVYNSYLKKLEDGRKVHEAVKEIQNETKTEIRQVYRIINLFKSNQ